MHDIRRELGAFRMKRISTNLHDEQYPMILYFWVNVQWWRQITVLLTKADLMRLTVIVKNIAKFCIALSLLSTLLFTVQPPYPDQVHTGTQFAFNLMPWTCEVIHFWSISWISFPNICQIRWIFLPRKWCYTLLHLVLPEWAHKLFWSTLFISGTWMSKPDGLIYFILQYIFVF